MAQTQRIARHAIQKRLYSAAAPKSSPKPFTVSPVQVGKASNGIRLAAQENESALARVVCAVKAGPRYEEAHQRGVAHCIRVVSDQTQKEARAFGLTRDLQQMGATITCTSTREHLLYTLEAPKSVLSSAMPYLSGMVAHQSFRPWEISDSIPRIDYELLGLSEQPEKRLAEKTHEVAYRETGLGRSLYAPFFMLSEFSPDVLIEYVNRNFTPDRISLSATGISLADLTAAAPKFEIGQPSTAADSKAKYHGGVDCRENTEDLIAYSTLVAEGASAGSDEMWAFAVLEQLLGAGPQVKWASNTTSSALNAAISKQTQDPFNVQAFNINYSDSGLFGISAVTVPENSNTVLRTAMEQLRAVSSALPAKDVLQGAKNRVKSSVAFQLECDLDTAQSRAVDLLTSGQVTDLQAVFKSVDAVSASAVQNAAKKVVDGKLAMTSIGEIYNVPYVDQL